MIQVYREKAEEIKSAYYNKKISYDEAKKQLAPCIKIFNDKSKELAKKYNQKPKLITVQGYLR